MKTRSGASSCFFSHLITTFRISNPLSPLSSLPRCVMNAVVVLQKSESTAGSFLHTNASASTNGKQRRILPENAVYESQASHASWRQISHQLSDLGTLFQSHDFVPSFASLCAGLWFYPSILSTLCRPRYARYAPHASIHSRNNPGPPSGKYSLRVSTLERPNLLIRTRHIRNTDRSGVTTVVLTTAMEPRMGARGP